MNKLNTSIFLCFMIIISLISCNNSGKLNISNKSPIKWETDFNKALELSKKENKLIMINFYTDWCVYCEELNKNAYTDKDVVNYAANFIPLKINPEKIENGQEIVSKYEITGYPTILFINADNFSVNKIIGYVEADELLSEMKEANVSKERIKLILNSPDITLEKLDIYLNSGYTNEAIETYTNLLNENKIIGNDKPKYISKIGRMFADKEEWHEAMKYFDDIISNYTNSDEIYIAHYYKSVTMLVDGKYDESLEYISSFTNEAPANIKEKYLNLIKYIKENNK